HYSVPPELARAPITVAHRLDAAGIELAASGGIIIARHHLAPAGAGATVRDTGHVLALARAAMAAFTTGAPHRRKQRIPPGPAARACRVPESGHGLSPAVSGRGFVVVDQPAEDWST